MDFMERIRAEHRFIENAIISVLNSRPRYLKWIPKMFYTKHFLEIHRQDSRPQIEKTEKGYSYSVNIKIRIYDKIRRKYINF